MHNITNDAKFTQHRNISFNSLDELMEKCVHAAGSLEEVFDNHRKYHKLILSEETLAGLQK